MLVNTKFRSDISRANQWHEKSCTRYFGLLAVLLFLLTEILVLIAVTPSFVSPSFPSYLLIFLYTLLRPAAAGQKRMSRLPTSFQTRSSMFLCTGLSATHFHISTRKERISLSFLYKRDSEALLLLLLLLCNITRITQGISIDISVQQ